MKIINKKILITGGGSGIGLGLTERLAKENQVIICGRRSDILDSAAEKFKNVTTITCDLSDSKQREHLFNDLKVNHPDLNVLVNNAGIQNWMDITDDHFFDKAKAEIAINIEAPIHLTKLFCDFGSAELVINVTSGLAFAPLNKVPVYSATKAFFHSFTLSMKELLKTHNIDVIEIIPPALNTDLGGKGLHDFAPPVNEFIDSIFQQLEFGKKELSFGTSQGMIKASEGLQNIYKNMNGIQE
jgi:uncharacterized oxidoreductase